jgi:hypothetical protein
VHASGFDRERGVVLAALLDFIRETNPMIEWEKLDAIEERTTTILEERRPRHHRGRDRGDRRGGGRTTRIPANVLWPSIEVEDGRCST